MKKSSIIRLEYLQLVTKLIQQSSNKMLTIKSMTTICNTLPHLSGTYVEEMELLQVISECICQTISNPNFENTVKLNTDVKNIQSKLSIIIRKDKNIKIVQLLLSLDYLQDPQSLYEKYQQYLEKKQLLML